MQLTPNTCTMCWQGQYVNGGGEVHQMGVLHAATTYTSSMMLPSV